MLCCQFVGGDGGFGGGVFDVLCFVEDQQVELLFVQFGGVVWQQGIGGQYQVVFVDVGEVVVLIGVVQGQYVQIGSEVFGFVQLVGDQVGGYYYQCWCVKLFGLFFQEYVGQ